jgi:hypothetical protein
MLGDDNQPLPYYRMNETGDAIVKAVAGTPIKPCEGVLVFCPNDGLGHSAIFTTTAPEQLGDTPDDVSWLLPVHHLIGSQPACAIPTTVTQTIELAEGWNWISTYIEMEGVDGLTMLQESLNGNGELIKQGVKYTEYDAEWDMWFDSGLTELSNDYMYLVKTTAACEVSLVGAVADLSDHAITIYHGWNWIGFPSAQTMTVEEAFSSFIPQTGDKIQYGVTFTEYDAEWGMWLDSGLTHLVPGRGYLYYYNGTTPQTLNFGKTMK